MSTRRLTSSVPALAARWWAPLCGGGAASGSVGLPVWTDGAALCQQVRSATKKQGGSTNNRGNQLPKMLGVKLFGGARAGAGAIIVRQRGTRVHAGDEGRDHTLFALSPGVVTFGKDRRTGRKTVSIVPAEA